jgi:hypothetical protein
LTSEPVQTEDRKATQPTEASRAIEQKLLKSHQERLVQRFKEYEEEMCKKNHHLAGGGRDELDPVVVQKNINIEAKEQNIGMLQRKIELVKEENGRFLVGEVDKKQRRVIRDPWEAVPKRGKEDARRGEEGARRAEPVFGMIGAGGGRGLGAMGEKGREARVRRESIGGRTHTSCFTETSRLNTNELLNGYNNKRIGIFFENMVQKTQGKGQARSSIAVFQGSTERARTTEGIKGKGRRQQGGDGASPEQLKRLTKVVGKLKTLLSGGERSRNASTVKKGRGRA